MGTVAEMFRAGGVWMYLLLAIAIFALGASFLGALAAVFVKNHKLLYVAGALLICCSLAGPIVGGIGYSVGMGTAEDAAEHAAPENRARLMERASEIASVPLQFGAVIAPLPLAVGVLTIFVGMRRRE